MGDLARGVPHAEAALTNLFNAYGALFVRRLNSFHIELDDAREIAQDLWIEIARAAVRYRPDRGPVRFFLLGFLRTARLRYFRRAARIAGGRQHQR